MDSEQIHKKKGVLIGLILAILILPFLTSAIVVKAQCSDSWFSKLIGVSESCGDASKSVSETGRVSYAGANGKQVDLDLSELADFVKNQKDKGFSDFELSMEGDSLTISAGGESKRLDLTEFANSIIESSVNNPNGDSQRLSIRGKTLTIAGGNSIDLAPFLGLADYSSGDGVVVSGSRVISSVLGTSISASEIDNGAVTNSKIADGTIRFSKLNDNECQGGQIIKYSGTDWTCGTGVSVGDVKSGMQAVDHGGWVKLDGRALASLTADQQTAATALGLTGSLPSADNAFLGQNGQTIGSVTGSNDRTLARNQLPNFTLGGTTGSAGSHSHSYTNPEIGVHDGSSAGPPVGQGRPYKQYPDENGGTTTSAGDHTHSFTTPSINGGVTQQQVSVTPRTLSVNVFIYLGL